MFLELITIAACLAICFTVAAWPVLMSPALRPKVQAACGSLCVLLGAGGFILLCSGASLAAAPAEPQTDAKPIEDSSLNSPPAVEPEPATKVLIPPGRPEWVESLPVRVGDVHTTAVSSGPYTRPQDAARALDNELVEKTREYIVEHVGSPMAANFIRYGAKQIKTDLVKPTHVYREEIVVSIGPMHQVHALLEFGPEFRAAVDRHWAAEIAKSRLLQTGLLAAAVLGLLATVFGYFRLDNATRGYYTGRLQAMAAVAILALVFGGVYFARLMPWL